MRKRRLFVVTGAGISAESGIPTFRGPEGYWRNLDPQTLATPAAFERDPALVWEWYQERRDRIRNSEPNAGHIAVVQLMAGFDEALLLTQNVDDLHGRARWAGRHLTPGQMVQIHGDIFVTRCSACAYQYREIRAAQAAVPACTKCGQFMRPGVVWFGEALDPAQVQHVQRFINGGPCTLTLVIGTTAIFGYIVDWTLAARGPEGTLIEINPAPSSLSQYATECIRAPATAALPEIAKRFL